MTQNTAPLLTQGFFTAAMKAYDAACQALPRNPSDKMRDLLATRVMELAERGERDPVKLRNYALAVTPLPTKAAPPSPQAPAEGP